MPRGDRARVLGLVPRAKVLGYHRPRPKRGSNGEIIVKVEYEKYISDK